MYEDSPSTAVDGKSQRDGAPDHPVSIARWAAQYMDAGRNAAAPRRCAVAQPAADSVNLQLNDATLLVDSHDQGG